MEKGFRCCAQHIHMVCVGRGQPWAEHGKGSSAPPLQPIVDWKQPKIRWAKDHPQQNAFPTTVITAQVSFTFKFYQRHCKVCCKIEHNMRPVVRLVIPLWKMVYAFFVLYSATVIRVTTNRYARVHIRAGKAIGWCLCSGPHGIILVECSLVLFIQNKTKNAWLALSMLYIRPR